MQRQELLAKLSINDRVLKSLLTNHGIDPNTEIIPNEIALKIAEQVANQSGQPQSKSPKSPQLNQSAPVSSLEELQQINAQNMVLGEELQKSALAAEVQRMSNQGTYVGAVAVAAYQQALLRQIAAGLGEWSQVANKQLQNITEIPLSTLQQTDQTQALNLIADNSNLQSMKLLPMFAPDISAD